MSEKLAFCPLLWEANGGRITEDGRPDFTQGDPVRGSCTYAFDCAECRILQSSLAVLPDHKLSAWWVCPDCASELMKASDRREVSLPGYYTSGYCQYQNCVRDPHNEDPEARYSIVLQLFVA